MVADEKLGAVAAAAHLTGIWGLREGRDAEVVAVEDGGPAHPG